LPKAGINGIDIDYKIEGRGEPLVMIAGVSSTKEAWLFQSPVFKKHFRVITFDNRGCGKSGKPSVDYSIRDMADDTAGLIDYLGFNKAHILGASMGGMIAQELAINYPEKINKLVLCCTFAKRTGAGGISVETVKRLGYQSGYSYDDLLNTPAEKILIALSELTFIKRINRLFMLPVMQFWIRMQDVSGMSSQLKAIWGHDTVDRLKLINAPTLLMAGTGDSIIDPLSSEFLSNQIPHSQLVKYKGGSHAFFVEMRKRFNREVIDYLKS
jgi:pimeloyl-ACP methyl ester carboxylesterase